MRIHVSAYARENERNKNEVGLEICPCSLPSPFAGISVVLITVLSGSWLYFFTFETYLLKWQWTFAQYACII